MKNKILSLVCLIALLFSTICPTVFATNESLEFELRALGVLQGINVEGDSGFTRGEFCKIVTNIIGYPFGTDEKSGNMFTDISDYEYADSINALSALGAIGGDGSGKFNPDNKIRLNEATKILVNILGYGVVLNDLSLDSYKSKAISLGLFSGVSSSAEYPDKHTIYIMIDNALDVPVLSDFSYLHGKEILEKGDSYRTVLTSGKHYEIQQLRGVVTADKSVYLRHKVSKMEDNELEIEGKIYKFEGKAPTGLVGLTVDFFQKVDYDGTGIVIDWKISDRNTVTEFRTKDIKSSGNDYLNCEDGRVKVAVNTVYLYNGRPETGWTPGKIKALENGSFRAIDNDKDGTCEVIYIWQYQNRIVESANNESKIVVFKDYIENSAKYIKLDIEDKALSTNLLAADGSVLDFKEIEPDMVVSLAVSKDKELITAVVCDETVEGVLEMISDECLVIGDKEYPYDLDLSKIKLGRLVKLFLNFEGVAVFSECETEKRYAYVYSIDANSRMNSEVQLILAGPVATRYREVEDLEGGGESTKTPELYARNEAVEYFELASKVKVDGEKTDRSDLAAKILYQPVAYTLDGEGKIKSFEILNSVDPGEPQKYYNANELIFGGFGTRAFGITQEESLSICLPGTQNLQTGLFTVDTTASDDDLLVYTKLASGSKVRYTASGYDVDDSSHIASLIVITSSMNADIADTAGASSEVGAVAGIRYVITEDDDIDILITLIHDGEERQYIVNPLTPSFSKFTSLSVGDLIAFTLDGFDKLSDCRVLQEVNNYNDFVLGENTEYERFCGIVTDLVYNTPSVSKNRWVHSYTLSFSDGSYTTPTPYDVFARGTTPVFIIESEDVVKSGTYEDILFGERVFFSVNNSNVRAIVIDRRDR